MKKNKFVCQKNRDKSTVGYCVVGYFGVAPTPVVKWKLHLQSDQQTVLLLSDDHRSLFHTHPTPFNVISSSFSSLHGDIWGIELKGVAGNWLQLTTIRFKVMRPLKPSKGYAPTKTLKSNSSSTYKY